MPTSAVFVSALSAIVLVVSSLTADPLIPRFRAVTVDTNVAVGYGVTVADVDGDGGPDIVLCDAKQIAWYRHPKWEKHVIAENLTPQDHVCVAAADIDGDG
ncbi:MAG: VCBS repeat-containing protein, partial [Proteobacteria bacterium]|nr:VCBS repeat-containing protein [Pseudomonadota bacterium]